jgi:methyl-accepting chemotaxis protein
MKESQNMTRQMVETFEQVNRGAEKQAGDTEKANEKTTEIRSQLEEMASSFEQLVGKTEIAQ